MPLPITLRRHAHPAITLVAFAAGALWAGALATAGGRAWLGAGSALVLLHWLVEWKGIAGEYQAVVPRHPVVIAGRAAWLAGLVVATLDAFGGGRWTPWQGAAPRAAGVALALAGIGLRLWAMAALARAFTYDVRVSEGQRLVRTGPYRWLRHPAYTGMLLWSLGLGLWNPSLPGLLLLVAGALPQLVHRIRAEEALLEGHFGEAWRLHARATARLVPGLW